MRKSVKLSIIIPIYNAEKYLCRCIESILAQPLDDYELILVNDGSKDHSGAICDDFAKMNKRIRVIHKKNGGVSSARNMGIDISIGEYVTFVDADDFLERNTLKKSLFDRECDLIQIPRNDGSFMKKYVSDVYCETQNDFRKFLYKNFYFECWGRLFKRSIIGSIRFNNDIKIGEDMLFLLDVYARVNSFFLSSNSGRYHYSYVESSAMHSRDISKEQKILANLVNEEFVRKENILAAIIMIEFFYARKICNVNTMVFSYSVPFVLSLPLSVKTRIKYVLGRFLFKCAIVRF